MMLKKLVSLTFALLIGSFAMATNISYLFVIHANSSQIQTTDHQTNLVTLTAPKIAYFTDRPARKTGFLSVQDFVNHWYAKGKDSFVQDHPNASIVAELGMINSKNEYSNFVVLSKPKYDANKDSLTFEAKLMKNNQALPTGQTGHIFLFVDSYELGCSVSNCGF